MTLRAPAISLVMAAIISLGPCWGAEPPPVLGQLDFPNSGSADAQPHFIEGVLYLHSFEYEQARASFRRAQQVDDDFAMAYWGETMTHSKIIINFCCYDRFWPLPDLKIRQFQEFRTSALPSIADVELISSGRATNDPKRTRRYPICRV